MARPIDPAMMPAMPMMNAPAPVQASSPVQMGGAPSPLPLAPEQSTKLYDVKIKRCIKSGNVRVRLVPPEDFFLDPEAMSIDENDGRFYGDIARPTRSDLKLKYPKKADLIDGLPSYSSSSVERLEREARERNQFRGQVNRDPSQDQIETYEVYIKVDYDGDGVSEWRQVCMAGVSGARELLSNSEWGGLLPYTDIVPNPIPHRRRGRSLYEDVYDIQRIKSVILRQTLDNLYATNTPRQIANDSAILNKDVLVSYGFGDTIFTKGDPNAAVSTVAVPFVAKESFGVLEYFDQRLESRTGVGRSSMALDPSMLQNQTATAAQIVQDIKTSKVETYARNIAEAGGLKRLFKCLLHIFVENQRVTKMIKLRNQWIEMDPRGWDSDMGVTINVGLGAGSRDRDLATLNAIAQKQELAIQVLGPFNPVLNISHLFDTYRSMAEAAGIKNPETRFPELPPEAVSQLGQMMQQGQKSPEQAKAEAQMQVEQMKLQANQQAEQARMQMDAQRDQQKAAIDVQNMQSKAEIEKIQAQADIATQDRKTQAELMLADRRFELEAAMKREEHAMRMAEMQAQAQQREREAEVRMVEGSLKAQQDREFGELKAKYAGRKNKESE